jgi:hypothetical protein
MTRPIGDRREKAVWALVAVMIVSGLSGCDGVLEGDHSGVILPDELEEAGPAAVPTLVNGMVGNYHELVDDIVLFTSLFTDEMIGAGTFPDRAQVDRRRIRPSNLSLSGLYSGVHLTRFQADTTVFQFQARLSDPLFEDVVDDLNEGIALGKLIGGYTRIWLAELYCWSILTGLFPEEAPLMPNDRMQQAIGVLQEAEAQAAANDLEDVRLAAIVGQARAQLWLGNFQQASGLAAQVPRNFIYWSEYSNNDPAQYNGVYTFTWGDPQLIHWTIGDGSSVGRGNERWEHLLQFAGLNLLTNRPAGFTSADSSIPVVLQILYNRAENNVLVASGLEARLIRAEAAVRAGQTEMAEDLINDLRTDYSLRATVLWGVPPPTAQGALQPIQLTGDLEADVRRVADERARELWLTGDRMTTARRLRLDPAVGINLFPAIKVTLDGGDDIAFPMAQEELDRNPNLSSPGDACPTGQEPGSWR